MPIIGSHRSNHSNNSNNNSGDDDQSEMLNNNSNSEYVDLRTLNLEKEEEEDSSAPPKHGEYVNIASLNAPQDKSHLEYVDLSTLPMNSGAPQDKSHLEYVDLSTLPMNSGALNGNDSSAPFNDGEYQNLESINQDINGNDSPAPFNDGEYQNLTNLNLSQGKSDTEYMNLNNLDLNNNSSNENDAPSFKRNEYQSLEDFRQGINAEDPLADLKEQYGIEPEDIDAEFDKMLPKE
jgi:hypothetical protein